jgi:hypothetical protein
MKGDDSGGTFIARVEVIIAHRSSVGEPQRKKPLARWEDNVENELR